MVAMPAPAGTCGEWTLNLEVAGLHTPALGLGGNNPFALELMDSDLHSFGCFNINNAIVGTQIIRPRRPCDAGCGGKPHPVNRGLSRLCWRTPLPQSATGRRPWTLARFFVECCADENGETREEFGAEAILHRAAFQIF